jgi:uncharacterized protein YndB with AHSA1/START domain
LVLGFQATKSSIYPGFFRGLSKRLYANRRAGKRPEKALVKPNRKENRMTASSLIAPASDRELVLTRLIAAPREKLYGAWTQPELLKQWFAPKPWRTPRAELDVRPGGASMIVMAGPDGTEFPSRGVYLEVVPNQRLVFTDAFTEAWQPSEKPFMTVVLTFVDEGGKTRYTARVLHWSVADREAHEKMGFHEGWGQCTDQLAELVGAPKPTA